MDMKAKKEPTEADSLIKLNWKLLLPAVRNM